MIYNQVASIVLYFIFNQDTHMLLHLTCFILLVIGLVTIIYFSKKQSKQMYLHGLIAGRKEIEEKYENIRKIEQETKQKGYLHIGSTVIMLSNEWEELTVGKIVGFEEKFNTPCIFDEVSETNVWGTTILPYDAQMLNALLKLNPFERWNLVSNKSIYRANQYNWQKNKKSEFDPNETIQILSKKGLI